MHHAHLATSPRLRRALAVLQAANGEISTLELANKARICAVGSVISELRMNGAEITCRQQFVAGERRWFYTLIKEPKA